MLPLGLAVGDVHQARLDADRRLLLTWGRGAGHRLPPVLAQVQRVGAQHGEDALPLPDASTDLLRGQGTGHGPQGCSWRGASPLRGRPGSGGRPHTFPFLVRICLQWSQPSFLTALNGTSERSEVECLLERASSDVPRLSRDCGGTRGHHEGDAISTPCSTSAPPRQGDPRPLSYRGTQASASHNTHPVGEEAPQHAEAGDPAGHPPGGRAAPVSGMMGREWDPCGAGSGNRGSNPTLGSSPHPEMRSDHRRRTWSARW